MSGMRAAMFSDVHGNTIALDAVLADIAAAGGVDAHWVVGDLAAVGFDPAGAVRRLQSLPDLKVVRGNTDREAARDEGDVERAIVDLAASDPAQARRMAAMQRNFAWTRGALMEAGLLDWLANLPVEERIMLPDGTRVLLVHAAPGTDDGDGIREEQSDDALGEVLAGAGADLVIVGHTHQPVERTVNGVRAWNLGNVSVPFTPEKRAMWTLLEADEDRYRLERRFVAYDHDAVRARLDAVDPPAGFVLRNLLAAG
jgi:predicted phosphodiesterase